MLFFVCFSAVCLGQHLKKSSLSESSSDMMDLEDGVDTTPNLMPDSQVRLVPFFGTSATAGDRSLQPNNCYKQTSSNGGQSSQQQQRHNSALAVSIETDVWLLGEYTLPCQILAFFSPVLSHENWFSFKLEPNSKTIFRPHEHWTF